MEFHTWINQKFIEWRGDTRNGVTEFATYLGISQPTVSAWLNKSRGKPETQKIIDALVNKYGDEAYKVLFADENQANIFSSAKRRLFERINKMSVKEAEEELRKIEKKR